jgi:hypothetical protein
MEKLVPQIVSGSAGPLEKPTMSATCMSNQIINPWSIPLRLTIHWSVPRTWGFSVVEYSSVAPELRQR